MAQTTMSLTEALGPLVDEQARRQFVEMDRRNGALKILVIVRHGQSGGFSVDGTYPADGEVIEVEKFQRSYDAMIRIGYFKEVPPGTPRLTHQPTARQFLITSDLERYSRDYENPQKRARAPKRYEPVLPELAPTVEPEVNAPEPGTSGSSIAPAHTGPGRKSGSKRVPPPVDVFKKKLGSIVNRRRETLEDKDEVSPEDVYLDDEWRKWQNCASSSSFYRRLKEQGINFPTFLSSLPWPVSLSQ